jgi:hypothetical protein
MRTQNVKALTELLQEAEAASSSRSILGEASHATYGDPRRLAEWLVEAGAVLVPSAVTEEDAMDLLNRGRTEVSVRATDLSQGPWFRESLCRIASDSASGSRDEPWVAPQCRKGTHR